MLYHNTILYYNRGPNEGQHVHGARRRQDDKRRASAPDFSPEVAYGVALRALQLEAAIGSRDCQSLHIQYVST